MYQLTFDSKLPGLDASPYKLDRISPSMMSTYLSCPLAFYYGYIAKIQIPQAKLHLLFGSAIHSSIEKMYEGHPNPEEEFKSYFKKDLLDAESQKSFGEYYLLGLEMLKNYIQEQKTLEPIYHLAAGKQEFRFKRYIINPLTGEPSSLPLSGVLDRITDENTIVEYKTSKTMWDPSETRFKIQSRLYNLWFFSENGRIAEKTLYLVLLKKYRRTQRDQVLQVIEYIPSLDDLAEMWYWLESVIEQIEAGMFERPSGAHPRYCDCYKYEEFLGIRT